ncbi:titin-like [Pollicipes pollicipes]|uniref:titin-like n=1 Tax=Pollicipes pollicipes TaxID=41117 RepID=UPI001884E9AB|nr:titin-like [Pollicipes pollicipes]
MRQAADDLIRDGDVSADEKKAATHFVDEVTTRWQPLSTEVQSLTSTLEEMLCDVKKMTPASDDKTAAAPEATGDETPQSEEVPVSEGLLAAAPAARSGDMVSDLDCVISQLEGLQQRVAGLRQVAEVRKQQQQRQQQQRQQQQQQQQALPTNASPAAGGVQPDSGSSAPAPGGQQIESRAGGSGDTPDDRRRFSELHEAVQQWLRQQQPLVQQPLEVNTLPELRTALARCKAAVGECPEVARQLSEMATEQTSLSPAPSTPTPAALLEDCKQRKDATEAALNSRLLLLQEVIGALERCEGAMMDVEAWCKTTRVSLSPREASQRPLDQQLATVEKLCQDIDVREAQVATSGDQVKLLLDSGGVSGAATVPARRAGLLQQLTELRTAAADRRALLRRSVSQLDQQRQEVQRLRGELERPEQPAAAGPPSAPAAEQPATPAAVPTGVSDEPPAAAAVKTQDIEKSVNELEASASQLAESPERDSLLVDVTDLRHRLTDLRGHYRPQQIMDKSQKRPRRRSKKSASPGESLQETRVDERGNTHRVERSTSSEIAQSLDETGAPVFVEQVRTEVRSDSKPVARQPQVKTSEERLLDAEGRPTVATTTTTTTYEDTVDAEGRPVVVRRVTERVCRQTDGQPPQVTESERSEALSPDEWSRQQLEPELPEPSVRTEVEEYEDELGRRVVITTTVTSTFERQENADNEVVILERVHRRRQKTVYLDGQVVEESELDSPPSEPPSGSAPVVEYVSEDFELPEPKTETRTEEYEDAEGRRVVVTTTITTTYEQTDDDEGNTVILEKVHRRVQRTIYVDGEVVSEQLEEPDAGPDAKDSNVMYVDENFQIPEPSETTNVQEFVDEEGRRVVVRTTIRTAYEETEDEDGSPLILEKIQKRVQRTVYVDGKIVEETIDAPDDVEENIELPPSTEREEVEEHVDDLGRRVVIRSVYTTTYEQDRDGDGNVVILEKVQKRVFRTVFVDGKEIVEEIRDPSRKKSVEYVLEIPEPKTEEHVESRVDENGRRVTIKTITRTTYEEGRDDDGTPVILEKAHTTRITYRDGEEVVEETSAENADQLTWDPARDFVLPEPRVTEEEREYIDEQGRTVVEKTTTTVTYEKKCESDGSITVLENVCRRVMHTVYVDGQVVEVIKDPTPEPDVSRRSRTDVESLVEKQPPTTGGLTNTLLIPKPSVVEDVVEHTEPDGRRVVTKTIITTTYDAMMTETDDVVVYEKVHRRILRTVYDGDQLVEEVEEPTPEPTVTKKTAEEIHKLSKQNMRVDAELPEPKTEEEVQESTDDQGRRIVTKTVTTTTYEKQTDDEGAVVILEKVQRRVYRTIYIGDQVIEEVDEPVSTSAVDMREAPLKKLDIQDTMEQPKLAAVATEKVRLPKPSTTEDVVEHTEPDGRRVVTRTVTTTTYETETTDSGDLVIYEKIHRRIFRTVYLGDQVMEEVEEPTTEPTMTKKTAKDIKELVMDVQLPEPKTEEHVTESVDEQGRRVVIKTVTTTTYEKQSDDEGSIVILEKVQRRVHRTIYAGDEVIEQIDEPDSTSSTNAVEVSEAPVKVSSRPDTKEMPKTTTAKTDEIRLPEPSTTEDVVEHTEPDGRRVVTRTVTTTTYETETTDSGDLVIYEKIHRRIFRTVYLGDQVIEEVEEPTTEPTMTQKTAKDIEELVVDIQLPEPKTEEHVTESVDEQGRRVVIKTVTTTTYEKQSDDEGSIVILEKVQRRVHRTIYAGDEVIEQIDEPDSTSSTNAVEVSEAPVKVSSRPDTKEMPKTTTGKTDEIRLPEPSTTEDVVEHTEPDGRRVVTRTVTTTTYETETTDSGDLVIYEKIHRRIFRTVYLGDQVIEEVEEPTTEPTMTQKTAKDIEELIMDIQLPEPKTEEHVTESVDEQGRRVVIKTVTTTTYEKQSDDEGNIVILEKVQRRVHRTIYAGDEVIEQIDEPDSTSSTNAVEVSEAPVKVSSRPDTKEMPKTTAAEKDEIRLPEPSTTEDVVEHTEPDGRRVVTRTVTTTTYETETTDSGDLVIYEKIHRRIFRTVYLGDQVIEEVEEPTTEPTMTKKTAKDIKELVLDVQLPEPKTEEHVTESVDEQGRRVVIKTVTTTTYEKQSDDEGNIVVLEKVQRRVHRTIYVGDKIVEEFEEPSKDPCTVHTSATEMSKLQKAVGDSENVVLPEPTIEETTEEFTEDDGRRVVVHTTITTTYDKVEENGHIVIVERVQKRVRKTIYVDGELVDVIEEVHGSADESSSAEDAPALIEWNDESDTTADTLPSEPATPVKVPTPLSPGDSKRDATSHPAVSFVPPANANEEPSQKLPEEDRVIVHKLEEFIRYMPAISGKLVEEPQVDEDLYETIENGRKVTYKTITITIIEERQNKEGKPSTVKRLVKHIIKTSDVNGKPVVEERSEPEVVEELTRDASVPKDTEALALPRDLPGHDVRTPFKSPIDESVEIAEEAFEDPPSSTAESVGLVLRPEQQISATKQDSKPLKSRPEKTKPPKKTKKKRDKPPTETPHPEQVDGKSAPELLQEAACSVTPEQDQLGDAEAPVIKQAVVVSEPSFTPKAQSEDEVIADALRSAEGEVSERPTVRTEVVESVDPQGRRVVLKRMYITIVEDIIDELGVVTKRTRVIRKAVRTTVAADGTVAVDVVEEPAEETDNIPLSVEEHGHASKEPAAPYLKAEDYVASLAAEKDWYDKALIDDAETVYHTKHGRAQASKQQDNSTAPMQTTANIKPVQAEQLEDNVASKVAVPSKSQAHLPCGLPWLNTFEINEAERVHHERTVSQLAPHRPLMEAEGKTQHVDTSPDVHSVEKDTKLSSVILHEEVSLDIYPLRDAERKFHERRVAQETKAPEMAEVHPDLGHETEEHKAPKEGSKDPPEVQHELGSHRALEADIPTTDPSQKPAFEPSDVSLLLEAERRPVEDISNVMKKRFEQPALSVEPIPRKEPTAVAMELPPQWPEADTKAKPQQAVGVYQTLFDQMRHETTPEEKSANDLPELDDLPAEQPPEIPRDKVEQLHELPELRPAPKDEVDLNLVLGRLIEEPVTQIQGNAKKRSETDVDRDVIEWPHPDKRPETTVEEIRVDASPIEMMAHQLVTPSSESGGLPPLSELLPSARKEPSGSVASTEHGEPMTGTETTGSAVDAQTDEPREVAPHDVDVNVEIIGDTPEVKDQAPGVPEAPKKQGWFSKISNFITGDNEAPKDKDDASSMPVSAPIHSEPAVKKQEVADVSPSVEKHAKIPLSADPGPCVTEEEVTQTLEATPVMAVEKNLSGSPEETNDSDIIESALAEVTGIMVEKPKVEAYIEETTDRHGRKVIIRRVFVTVVEEVVDETGNKVTISRVIKKQKRCTKLNGQEIVEISNIPECKEEGIEQQPHDEVLEHAVQDTMLQKKPHATNDQVPSVATVTEPLTSLSDAETISTLLPASGNLMVSEPVVERDVTETVDRFGRKVTVVRVYITVWEEVISETGEKIVQKRRVSSAQKVTNLPSGPVVERIDERDLGEIEKLDPNSGTASDAKPVERPLMGQTDEQLVQLLLPKEGNFVGTPEVERFEKEVVDENGQKTRVVRIYLTIVEEIVTESGTKQLVRKRISKTQKSVDMDGNAVTEDTDDPIVIETLNVEESTAGAKPVEKEEIVSATPAVEEGDIPKLTVQEPDETTKVAVREASEPSVKTDKQHRDKPSKKHSKKQPKAPEEPLDPYSASLDPKKVEEELLQLLMTPSKEDKKRKPRKRSRRRNNDAAKSQELSNSSEESPKPPESAPASVSDGHDLIVEVNDPVYGHAVVVTHFDEVENDKESDHETYFKDSSVPVLESAASEEKQDASQKKKHRKKKRVKRKGEESVQGAEPTIMDPQFPNEESVETSEAEARPDDTASTVSSHETTEDSNSLHVERKRPRRRSRHRSKSPRPKEDTELDDIVRMIEDPNIHPEYPTDHSKKPADAPDKKKPGKNHRSKASQEKTKRDKRPTSDEPTESDELGEKLDEFSVDTVTEPKEDVIAEVLMVIDEPQTIAADERSQAGTESEKTLSQNLEQSSDVEVADDALEAAIVVDSVPQHAEDVKGSRSTKKTKSKKKSHHIEVPQAPATEKSEPAVVAKSVTPHDSGASEPKEVGDKASQPTQSSESDSQLPQDAKPAKDTGSLPKQPGKQPKQRKADKKLPTGPDSSAVKDDTAVVQAQPVTHAEEAATDDAKREPVNGKKSTKKSKKKDKHVKPAVKHGDSIEIAEEASESLFLSPQRDDSSALPGDGAGTDVKTPGLGNAEAAVKETQIVEGVKELQSVSAISPAEESEAERLVVQEILAPLDGKYVEKPDVQISTETSVDENGQTVYIKRIRVTIVEEIIDEQGNTVTRRRVIKKVRKTTPEAGKPLTEEFVEPEEIELVSIPEVPKHEDVSDMVYRVTTETTSLSREQTPPEKQETIDQYVDEQGRQIKVRKIVQTVTDTDSEGNRVQRVVTRIVRMVLVNGEEIPVSDVQDDASLQTLEFDVQRRPAEALDSQIVSHVHRTSREDQTLDREASLPLATEHPTEQLPTADLHRLQGLPLSTREVRTVESATPLEDASKPADHRGEATSPEPTTDFVVVDYQEPVEIAALHPDSAAPEMGQGLTRVEEPAATLPDVGVSVVFDREGQVREARDPRGVGQVVLSERDALVGVAQQPVEESVAGENDMRPESAVGMERLDATGTAASEALEATYEKESPLHIPKMEASRQAVVEVPRLEPVGVVATELEERPVASDAKPVPEKEVATVSSERVVRSAADITDMEPLDTTEDQRTKLASSEEFGKPTDVGAEYVVCEIQQSVENAQLTDTTHIPQGKAGVIQEVPDKQAADITTTVPLEREADLSPGVETRTAIEETEGEDFAIPEDTVKEEEREFVDENGRRVVVRTTTVTTYEKRELEDGTCEVVKRVQRRIKKLIYDQGHLVQELQEEEGSGDGSDDRQLDLTLPEPTKREEVSETTDELGRHVVIRTYHHHYV